MNATAPAAAVATSRPPTVALDHLSWSSIKTYATCPRKFAYRYIEQADPEFVPAALAFGSAFHAAVDCIHQARIEGRDVPTVESILTRYDDAWKSEVESEIRFAKDDDTITLRESAERMLDAYREFIVASGVGESASIIAIEESRRFRLLVDVPPIDMRLDLLELTASGDLIVSDVKTCRSRWNETTARENLPQLVLYANGILPLVKELGAKRIVPRFVVVTKAKKPVVQVIEPKATQDDVSRLKDQVAVTWSAIQAGIFVRRESWACMQCPFQKRCLG